MTKYIVVESHYEDTLASKIEQWLAEGWQLYGNLIITPYIDKDGDQVFLYSQVVVK